MIGRNEGERLGRSLASCLGRARRVVYADSGSSDGSPERAASMGVDVETVDLSVPGNAARGRNAGFRALLGLEPDLRYVLFLDGDCELVEGFLDSARAELERDGGLGIVCGRRRELRPQDSLYNRLVDCEWNTPIGPTAAAGGDALVRVRAFEEAGGYDEGMSCGEDPEFSHRVRLAGFGILRIDADMTRHDVGLSRFGAWWQRHGRGGYAYMHGCAKHWRGPERYNQRACASIAAYGLVFPLVLLAGLPLVGLHAAWGLVLYARLGYRVARFRRDRGDGRAMALLYALHVVPGKLAEGLGLLRCLRDLLLGRRARVLEYKDYQRQRAA